MVHPIPSSYHRDLESEPQVGSVFCYFQLEYRALCVGWCQRVQVCITDFIIVLSIYHVTSPMQLSHLMFTICCKIRGCTCTETI